MVCRVCGNSLENTEYTAREMMFGLRDEFAYFQCSACGCLQIESIPDDMSEYYPADYYSYSQTKSRSLRSRLASATHTMRYRYALMHKGVIGRLLYKLFPIEMLHALSHMTITTSTRVLDVGSGAGLFVRILRDIGVVNVLGIDPFVAADIHYDNGAVVLKKSINDVNGTWDLITLNHSFEHMPDPANTLKEVVRLLDHNGTCVIRIPTVSSYAWEHYRENWAQFDAPRHFFLHSIESMRLLAEQANLFVDKVVYDSTDFQFWASEQFVLNHAMSELALSGEPLPQAIYSRSEIAAFKARAKELNRTKQGDSCAVFLRRSQ